MKLTTKQYRSLFTFTSRPEILGEETITKVVRKPIPSTTGYGCWGNSFPEYLKEFRNCYREGTVRSYDNRVLFFVLKDEFVDNRPEYEIEISYKVKDVKLTDREKEIIVNRMNQHKKLYESYKKMYEAL